MTSLILSISQRFKDLLEDHIIWLFRLYPPYLGAGIWVEHISEDFREISVRMPLRFYNQNYVGTQYGGSIYSMCDPFYVFMLLKNLGSDFIVWDKSASITFQKPGRGTVRAHFELTEERIRNIKEQTRKNNICEPIFEVDVVDEKGDIVAQVTKRLHVRRKNNDQTPRSKG